MDRDPGLAGWQHRHVLRLLAAIIQFAAASTGNPHLKTMFPISSSLDSDSAVNHRGGVFNETFNTLFSWSTGALEGMATPVDVDENGSLLAQARSERSGAKVGEKSAEIICKYPFHHSTTPEGENVREGKLCSLSIH